MESMQQSVMRLMGKQERLPRVENLQMLQSNIREYGFLAPIVLDDRDNIVAGCEQFFAAVSIDFRTVPCIYRKSLTDEEFSYCKAIFQQELCQADWDSIAMAMEQEI